MRPSRYTAASGPGKYLAIAALAVVLVLLSPLILLALLGRMASFVLVHVAAWCLWLPHGKRALVVYSDSVIWKEYFEVQLLPRIHDQSVILNWSERKRWKRPSLATFAFRRLGGYVNFNPAVFVFQPFRRVKILRYYVPFKEFKRGDPAKVESLTAQLLTLLESANGQQHA